MSATILAVRAETTTKVPVPNVVVFDKEAAPIKRGGIKQVYF